MSLALYLSRVRSNDLLALMLRTAWQFALQREVCQQGQHVTTCIRAKTDKDVASFPAFRLNDDALTPEFDKMWKAAGISGLTGHRSVGGYRASMYNALPIESVAVLVDVMKEFERSKG